MTSTDDNGRLPTGDDDAALEAYRAWFAIASLSSRCTRRASELRGFGTAGAELAATLVEEVGAQLRAEASDPAHLALAVSAWCNDQSALLRADPVGNQAGAELRHVAMQLRCVLKTGEASQLPTKERVNDRQDRRLARLEQLGGAVRQAGTTWHIDSRSRRGALADLVREEQRADRPCSDSKAVRRDLTAAANRAAAQPKA